MESYLFLLQKLYVICFEWSCRMLCTSLQKEKLSLVYYIGCI